MTFCKLLYHRKCKRRGVGGQKNDLVNVVCECPLKSRLHIFFQTKLPVFVSSHRIFWPLQPRNRHCQYFNIAESQFLMTIDMLIKSHFTDECDIFTPPDTTYQRPDHYTYQVSVYLPSISILIIILSILIFKY